MASMVNFCIFELYTYHTEICNNLSHLFYKHYNNITNIAECWENVYKATYKRDTVSAISAQLSGFAATMSTSTCRSSFMLAVCSSAQYLFRKVHRRFERRSSSYVYHSPLSVHTYFLKAKFH